MQDGVRRMRAFIDDLLRYSQSTHAGSDVRQLDLEEVLDEVISSLGAAIEESGAKITHDSLPVLITDSSIEHVLQNLIEQCDQVSPQGRYAGDSCVGESERDTWVILGPR